MVEAEDSLVETGEGTVVGAGEGGPVGAGVAAWIYKGGEEGVGGAEAGAEDYGVDALDLRAIGEIDGAAIDAGDTWN